MLWMEIYWTGDPAECSTLHSLVTAAIDSCAEPLAYHPSSLKCDPGTLCNLIHHVQQDMPKKVPMCWYVLESNVKEEGEKNDHGIVSLFTKHLATNEEKTFIKTCEPLLLSFPLFTLKCQQNMPPVHVALVTVNKRNIQDLPPVELSEMFQSWMEGFGESLYFYIA